MKKKGFTLIELIVVIAIIGVLAAILVPAMLGYVKKSKITTANTTAKSIYNAFNTALVDLDTQDAQITQFDTLFASQMDGSNTTNFPATVTTLGTTMTVADLGSRVYSYFSDIAKVKDFQVTITNGACVACGVMSGAYPGSYPKAMTVDAYANSTWTSAQALTYAAS